MLTKRSHHPTKSLLIFLSSMMERAAYYGIRTTILLYLISEIIGMNREEAFSIIGFFTSALIFSKIIGAVLGDLVLGAKKALLIGLSLCIIGTSCFLIDNNIALYVGFSFLIIGTGLYGPNISATVGRTYYTKKKLLDAGFTAYYLALNLGSFLGILSIGIVAEKIGYSYAFALGMLYLLISFVSVIFFKNIQIPEITISKTQFTKRIKYIFLVIIAGAIFWSIRTISSAHTFKLISDLKEVSSWELLLSEWSGLEFYFFVPLAIITIFLWSFWYTSQFFKIVLAFVFGAVAMTLLFIIPESPWEYHVIIYLIALFFSALSELFISPILMSFVTRYSNPKYLAIFMSILFLPSRLIMFLIAPIENYLFEKPMLASTIAFISMTFFAILLSFLFVKYKSRLIAIA